MRKLAITLVAARLNATDLVMFLRGIVIVPLLLGIIFRLFASLLGS